MNMRDPSNDGRFASSLGDDYNHWQTACPHHEEFQATIGEAIKKKFGAECYFPITGLEIGCGTGITTKVIMESDQRIYLHSIDAEQRMIEQAQKRFKKRGMVSFENIDALSFLESICGCAYPYDFVASAYTLHNIAETERIKIYSYIFNVLSPGGIFINGDKIAQDDYRKHIASLDWQMKQMDVFNTQGKPELINDWTKHFEEDDAIKIKEGEYVQTLRKIGFRDVRKTYRNMMEATIVATK